MLRQFLQLNYPNIAFNTIIIMKSTIMYSKQSLQLCRLLRLVIELNIVTAHGYM